MSERGWSARALQRSTCAIALTVLFGALGCFRTTPQTGGESHFLRGCADASCGSGLSCVCGVCTKTCEGSATCAGLAGAATCVAPNGGAAICQSDAALARACDATCKTDTQCTALGAGFACKSGRCREQGDAGTSKTAAALPDAGICEGCGASLGDGSVCPAGGCVTTVQPLVMLLVDSSGSMERKTTCACSTPACTECLPDCAKGERSRWVELLEVLTGSYQNYACQSLERSMANGASFDLGYYLPHVAPSGTQAADGVLDRYKDRLRFGMATFDGWDTYLDAPPLVDATEFDFAKSADVGGLWSYNPERALHMPLRRPDGNRVGLFRYPGCANDYYMDTGIRGPQATQGGVMVATDAANALEINKRIQASLLQVRPYGGTPIAAALDDLYYYLWGDLAMQGERAPNAARRHVVLITDGYPDDDYRSFHCDCATAQSPSDPDYCGGPSNDPSVMHCPYPTPEEAARELRCGLDSGCDYGVVQQVHVLGYAIDAPDVGSRLDAIAQAGGDTGAHLATDAAGLRQELERILDEIASQP